MKILNVINSSAPEGGGPIESIRQAAAALASRGHEMEIACLDAPDASWLGEAPVRTHALGPAISKYRFSSRFLPWLRENIPGFRCVIVHGIWLYPSLATWLALRRAETPYFVYSHGLLDPTFRHLFPLKHIQKTISWRLAEHRVIRDARAVFFTCEEERRLAHNSFKPFVCNDAIVPYCVGAPPSDPAALREAFLRKHPGLRDKTLALFLSRIHPKKGCDTLIRAFASVRHMQSDLHLVMAGPDSIGWRKDLEALARQAGVADRITWTGMLSGDVKWGAFSAADCFVLPSHQENFGIAVVEALACGLPVLISKGINIWREIEADGAGLVAGHDVDSTANLLADWIRMPPDRRAAMKQAAAACFASRFRSDKAADNLLHTLETYGVG